MFNLGPEKILVILAIALIVLGPDKLPEAARKAGQVLGNLRRLSGGFEHEIRQALDEPMQAFHREFSATTQTAPTETVVVGGPATNGASGDTPNSTADPEVPIGGSVAAEPGTATGTDTAPAESVPSADAATPADRADEPSAAATADQPSSPHTAADDPSSPAAAADQTPPSRPADEEAAGPASTQSLPSWVFGRGGESGPAFH